MQPLRHLEWKVKYEPGVLEARGTKDGRVVLVEKRETTGEPASIRLSADRNEINADREDIAVICVQALDQQGRVSDSGQSHFNFDIGVEDALIGVGNGDPNCRESDRAPRRSLFDGLAQVVVQATRTPGAITLEAYTEDWPPPKLPPTHVMIRMKKVGPRPAVPPSV